MAEKTKIQWTDHTFNGWIGCKKVSPGCAHCYAEVDTPARASRSKGLELWGAAPHAARRLTTDAVWQQPGRWDRNAIISGIPHRVFTASQSDVFEDYPGQLVNHKGELLWWHPTDQEQAPRVCQDRGGMLPGNPHPEFRPYTLAEARARLFREMEYRRWLRWQVLTKRPENVPGMVPPAWLSGWPAHVWLGVSVENQRRADERVPHLLRTPAAVRFLSIEPCLGPVDLWRWIGERKRKGFPSAAGPRVVCDPGRREHLEERGVSGGRPTASDGLGGRQESGRERVRGERLSAGDVSRRGTSVAGGSASGRVDVGEPRRDTGADGSQSQGRDETQQPPEQPGVTHPRGKHTSQFQGTGAEGEGTAGCEEYVSETGRGQGLGDQEPLREQHSAIAGSDALRRFPADRLRNTSSEDMAARPLIHWVIVGGESGPHARPCNPSWVKSLVNQCRAAGVACFVKQLGSNVLDFAGRLRDPKGADPEEWPEDLRVREWPEVAREVLRG